MKHPISHLVLSFVVMLMVLSCQQKPQNVQKIAHSPQIFPDYIDVTIPAGIAPMNFEMEMDDVELMDVRVRGSKKGEIHCQGDYADFNLEEWHSLTEANRGGYLVFTVCVKQDGRWLQYEDFRMHVSPFSLDDYGLTYRLIAPGYEVGGEMGLYQRDLHSFDEYALLEDCNVPGQCINCHTANQGSSDQFLFHVRGEKNGTLIQQGKEQVWLHTMTDSTRANFGYSYWHPSGRYIASSINRVYQLFYTGGNRRIEVFDTMSDVVVLDTHTNQLLLNPQLQQKDWLETYPVFSADGTAIFFCTARSVTMPEDCAQIRYSLCRIGFDATTGNYGSRVDTLLSASRDFLSYTFPRPSFDGRWLMYCVSDFGNFPTNHPESQLCLMDLRTGMSRPLVEVNSDESESFHGWSTNSHWFVFASRRGDGMYNRAYLSSLDAQGRATKPFLLPQRHPRLHYAEMLRSYNCPDFTHERIQFDVIRTSGKIMHEEKQQVHIRR